jgi:S1-C subfamily serine protease
MVRFAAMVTFVLTWISMGDCDCLHAQDSVRDSVVKIHTTLRMPDYYRPWAKSSLRESGGTGVFIDCDLAGEGDYVLTNAHVVKFASQIYVQPNRTTEKLSATVVAIAPGIDLALLKIDAPAELPDHERLPLAEELPRIKDTVNAYGFPIGGDELSITEGIVSRIEFADFYFDVKGVRIQIDAALNPGEQRWTGCQG